MSAIILVWDPDEWNGWTYPAVVEEVAEAGRFLATWQVGSAEVGETASGHPARGHPTSGHPTSVDAEPGEPPPGSQNLAAASSGAEAWLVLKGRHGNGLIGHGVIVSEAPALRAHPPGIDGPAPVRTPLYVRVAFDALLPAGDQIPPGILKEALPAVDWAALHGSGVAVDPSDEPVLRGLWSEFGPQPPADPTQPVPGTVPAAAVSRIEVNRYEHSPDARRACIAHHGTSCAVCGFSFEIAYGEIGRDFIPVHHLVPVSQLGATYELDPVTDLVPLCANCHAMAHLGVTTPRTVAELRRAMAAAGYLTGHALTPDELQAQQDARRILEQH